MLNYYDILGLSHKTSSNDIKKEYRRLVLKFHPDVCKEPNAENRFKEIVEAFKTLSDPIKKQEYDKRFSEKKYRVVSTFPNTKEKKINEKKENPKNIFKLTNVLKRIFLRMKTISATQPNNNAAKDNFFVIEDKRLDFIPVEELIDKFYKSDNKFVRAEALKFIIVKQGRKAFKEIEKGFKDIAKEVRLVAIRAVGFLNIRQFIKSAYALYNESGRELRKEIIISLGKMDSQKAVQIITSACFDQDDNVKIEALKIIKKINNVSVSHKFKNLLYEKNEDVKNLAREIIGDQIK